MLCMILIDLKLFHSFKFLDVSQWLDEWSQSSGAMELDKEHKISI